MSNGTANSEGMLPNGRAATAEVAQESQRETARILAITNGQEINPAVQEKVHRLIVTAIKSSEGLTSQLFSQIRACGSYGTVVGTFAAAEATVLKELKSKSLSALSKDHNNALASYISIKSMLFGALKRHEDLGLELQALWLWMAEHEGTEKKYLADGYLDAWSKRYESPVKGPALFVKDYKEASTASKQLEAKKAAHGKAQAQALAKAESEGRMAPGPNGGIKSGGGAGAIDEATSGALKELIQLVHEVYGRMRPETIRAHLYTVMAAIRTEDTKLRSEAGKASMEETAKEEATEAKDSPDLPEVDIGPELTEEEKKLVEEMENATLG